VSATTPRPTSKRRHWRGPVTAISGTTTSARIAGEPTGTTGHPKTFLGRQINVDQFVVRLAGPWARDDPVILGDGIVPSTAPPTSRTAVELDPRRGRRVPLPQALDVVRHRHPTIGRRAAAMRTALTSAAISHRSVGDRDADPSRFLHRLRQAGVGAHAGRVRRRAARGDRQTVPRGRHDLADGIDGSTTAVSAQRQRLATQRLLGQRQRDGGPGPHGCSTWPGRPVALLAGRRRPDHARRRVDHALGDHRAPRGPSTLPVLSQCRPRRTAPRPDAVAAVADRHAEIVRYADGRRSGNATTPSSCSCSLPRCTWPDDARSRHLHRRRPASPPEPSRRPDGHRPTAVPPARRPRCRRRCARRTGELAARPLVARPRSVGVGGGPGRTERRRADRPRHVRRQRRPQHGRADQRSAVLRPAPEDWRSDPRTPCRSTRRPG
jgi:hypothetical protein